MPLAVFLTQLEIPWCWLLSNTTAALSGRCPESYTLWNWYSTVQVENLIEAFIVNYAARCQVSLWCHYHINHCHRQSIFDQQICKTAKISTNIIWKFLLYDAVSSFSVMPLSYQSLSPSQVDVTPAPQKLICKSQIQNYNWMWYSVV